ncbi:MAG: hypothetical protein KGL39_05180 [Patescibacteria group bacterium]|nr:hypothetical protein [Patescibacteria group bacterium]
MQDIDQRYMERKTAAQEKCRTAEAKAHAMMAEALKTFAAETHEIEAAWAHETAQRQELTERARSGALNDRDRPEDKQSSVIDMDKLAEELDNAADGDKP